MECNFHTILISIKLKEWGIKTPPQPEKAFKFAPFGSLI